MVMVINQINSILSDNDQRILVSDLTFITNQFNTIFLKTGEKLANKIIQPPNYWFSRISFPNNFVLHPTNKNKTKKNYK